MTVSQVKTVSGQSLGAIVLGGGGGERVPSARSGQENSATLTGGWAAARFILRHEALLSGTFLQGAAGFAPVRQE